MHYNIIVVLFHLSITLTLTSRNQFVLTTVTVIVMAIVWVLGVVLLSEAVSSFAYIWTVFLALQSGVLFTIYVFPNHQVYHLQLHNH